MALNLIESYLMPEFSPDDLFTPEEAKEFLELPAVKRMQQFCEKYHLLNHLSPAEVLQIIDTEEIKEYFPHASAMELAQALQYLTWIEQGELYWGNLRECSKITRDYVDATGKIRTRSHFGVSESDKEQLLPYHPTKLPADIPPKELGLLRLAPLDDRGWMVKGYVSTLNVSKNSLFNKTILLEKQIDRLKNNDDNLLLLSDYIQVSEDFINAVLDFKNKAPSANIAGSSITPDSSIDPNHNAHSV